MIIAGSERGKAGQVLAVFPSKERATVELRNMIKRHTKARTPQGQSGIIEREAPIHLSNLMIVCPRCDGPVKVGRRRLADGGSVRFCRKCSDQIDR